jgi:predicted metal-dependent enzyme (double-stranded beta helix superfamily)
MSTYDLPEFCADVRAIVAADGQAGLGRVADKLRALLANETFVKATWDESVPPGKRVLYHDSELDFFVLAHVHPKGKIAGPPHSHGTSWAVYGNARGGTDMTIWKRVNPESEERAELVAVETYRLNPGDAYAYPAGMIHSTMQPEPAWVLRVTGTDLDVLPRYRFRPDRDVILEAPVAG